jgi:hypothetical protein
VPILHDVQDGVDPIRRAKSEAEGAACPESERGLRKAKAEMVRDPLQHIGRVLVLGCRRWRGRAVEREEELEIVLDRDLVQELLRALETCAFFGPARRARS